MKSRTSSFNSTVFKKDITRFAPAWGVYLIILLLTLVTLGNGSNAYHRVREIPSALMAMVVVNMIYGAVVAQLLFGDLYNSRLCNALHALPVTRDGWFLSHSAAGLAFSLVPNLVVMLLAFPVLRPEAGWMALIWWLLASEMQYIFYFGTAVLCMMLSGNRLGQLALYAMISFAGLAAVWLAVSFYEPLLYGIRIDEEAFYPFCPLAYLTANDEALILHYNRIEDAFGNFLYNDLLGVSPGNGWGYMAICAGMGILALIGALVLYRKRKLECAGDFVAFKAMEPVVQVLVTLFAGGFFHLFGEAFGIGNKYLLVFCGMVVGFFGCRMLLMRTNRVFQKKAFLACGAVIAVFALTLGLTYLDPIGITRWVPEAEEVESITFSRAYSLYVHNDFPFTAEETRDIEAILDVHEDCISGEAYQVQQLNPDSYQTLNLRLEYKLKNGKTVNRFYDVYPLSQAGQVLKGYFTRFECVLGFPEERIPEMAACVRSFYTDGYAMDPYDLGDLDLEELLRAIVADCEAGNMAQFSGFHYPEGKPVVSLEDVDETVTYLEIGWDHEKFELATQGDSVSNGIISYSNVHVYRTCENTIRWLEENNLLTDEIRKEMAEKYGGIYIGDTAVP